MHGRAGFPPPNIKAFTQNFWLRAPSPSVKLLEWEHGNQPFRPPPQHSVQMFKKVAWFQLMKMTGSVCHLSCSLRAVQTSTGLIKTSGAQHKLCLGTSCQRHQCSQNLSTGFWVFRSDITRIFLIHLGSADQMKSPPNLTEDHSWRKRKKERRSGEVRGKRRNRVYNNKHFKGVVLRKSTALAKCAGVMRYIWKPWSLLSLETWARDSLRKNLSPMLIIPPPPLPLHFTRCQSKRWKGSHKKCFMGLFPLAGEAALSRKWVSQMSPAAFGISSALLLESPAFHGRRGQYYHGTSIAQRWHLLSY